MVIGILAIQGSVIEHKTALQRLGVRVKEVRQSDDLDDIHGLILPGGESTTISKLLKRFGLFDELKKRIAGGLPVWGTCAGAILLAKKVTGKNPPATLAVMDIEADRNAYGRQLNSFETEIKCKMKNASPTERYWREKYKIIKGIFIRAPRLKAISDVQILAKHKKDAVMMRQDNMLTTGFHPELTDDLAIHRYFLDMCTKKAATPFSLDEESESSD